ncbi:hypothetical protein, partial [Mycobacterium malmoense]|uniref:hypothetical protein n=1 Tax=Mycobacterium malmoense TaxID=1780 RepID=UPI001C42F390
HTRRAPITLDTFQRDHQVPWSKHLPPPHLHTSRFGGTGFTIRCWLTPTDMPSMRFVSLGAGFRLRLPSHPTSQ